MTAQPRSAHPPVSAPAPGRARHLADRWFRLAGVATLVALGATGVMLLTGTGAWRVPFVLAHLGAASALLPLAVTLVATEARRAHRERGSVPAAAAALLGRDRRVTALAVLFAVAVAVSLSQFPDGIRPLRSAANLTAVGCAVTLVVRYLRRS